MSLSRIYCELCGMPPIYCKCKKITVYKIKSLEDIFNLPNNEMIERCMRCLTNAILMAKVCKKNKNTFKFPDYIYWSDDGKNVITIENNKGE